MWLAVRHGMGKAISCQSVLQEVSDRTWFETSIIVVSRQVLAVLRAERLIKTVAGRGIYVTVPEERLSPAG